MLETSAQAALKRLATLYNSEATFKKRDAKHPDSYSLFVRALSLRAEMLRQEHSVDKDHQGQIQEGIEQCLQLQKSTKVRLPYGTLRLCSRAEWLTEAAQQARNLYGRRRIPYSRSIGSLDPPRQGLKC